MLLAAALLTAGHLPRASAASESFEPLFNGSDLSGWKAPDPNPFWRVEDGVLVGENDEKLKGNTLYTSKTYKDFVLEGEVRWSGEIDSGFMLRKPELQLQIGVSRSLKKDMTCSFYTGGTELYPESGQGKGVARLLKPDDWNKIRLEAKGNTFTVWLNGEKTTVYSDTKYKDAGPIGVQIHGGLKMKVEFRNLRIHEL